MTRQRPSAIPRDDTEIARAGDAAVLVRLGADISPAGHAHVLALLHALDDDPPAGLRDLVPAYASVLVVFDPAITTPDAVETHVRVMLNSLPVRRNSRRGRLVRVPVRYGGTDGPDLEDVADLAGLPPEEVVRRHASAEYRVYFLGFVAGFPYLGGLPPELAVPRLPSPRPQVPAGSVGIGGQQTGIYPVAAPGGWRLIGHTSSRLFDPAADPPALLRPGDRIHFEPVCDDHDADVVDTVPTATNFAARATRPPAWRAANSTPVSAAPAGECVPWLRVRTPGPLSTVQDLGRAGYARYGIAASGAADADALRLGNALLGNPPGAAGLEMTLGGVELEALAPCAVAVTGAECEVCVDHRRARMGVTLTLSTGDILNIGPAKRGVRVYLCMSGGVDVPPVLGSRSTDLRAGLGGLLGRSLRAGDVLLRGVSAEVGAIPVGSRLPIDPVRRWPANAAWTLRVLPGLHGGQISGNVEALMAQSYVVDPRSDRVGVRLRGCDTSEIQLGVGGETITEGVPRGAVQLPPDGEPIILLADHQTTGGYRVPAVVATADLWRVAQLRPGDSVRFATVTPEAASAMLRAREEWLEQVRAGGAGSAGAAAAHPRPGEPDVEQLMRGFAEWSEEAFDDE
ncbi:MAG TPA: 5-oxoprolinase subunit PxpB [Ktedonobacterales bacterium]|nr:5-oxoprolinase subunit PxpB [Ktedonobacterales bacterium]